MSNFATRLRLSGPTKRRILLAAAALAGTGLASSAQVTELPPAGLDAPTRTIHVDQFDLLGLVARGGSEAFEHAFEAGDELFETRFNALDGVGANVGNGERFTRVPRADQRGPMEWAQHVPERTTGPNAEACNACHFSPFDDGAGLASSNVHRDPFHTGSLDSFIQRNTPHLFGAGVLQRLGEEMTVELHALRDDAIATVEQQGGSLRVELVAKGVSFGSLEVERGFWPPRVSVDTSRVRGVDEDLIVRPYQWKGSVAFLRDFNRGACHNELGMQPVEMAGDGIDGDGDGVTDEMTVGDLTAIAIYLAAQPRPTTKMELAALGLIELGDAEMRAIRSGRRIFDEIGCTGCHVPSLEIDVPTYSEPSASEHYRDATFPAGQDPYAMGLDWQNPVRFDLTADQPDNQLAGPNGAVLRLGALRTDARGRGIARLFGDLKRHDMGRNLAESIDETGSGRSVFMTENLWGVGSTAPYLHDGRATTLSEAILAHGGEADPARDAFRRLPPELQANVVAFLDNLVLFKVEEEEKAVVLDAAAFTALEEL